MKKISLFALTVFSFQLSFAQIAKTSIVEHFTNSNCSICASQNPGIYTTLSNNPNVLHITYHPSAPYLACVFSMANPVENDARTNYYNIYGSTPRLIVNGTLTTTANLSTTITGLNASMTNFSVIATQQFITPDSVVVKVAVKKVAADTMTQAILFAGAKQDTINQTTGNGESIHQDVFRKALSATSGDTINLPVNINDSTNISYSYNILPTWNSARMQTIVILQDANKLVINASESTNILSIPTSILEKYNEIVTIYPNPSSDFISIKSYDNFTNFEIISLQGNLITKGKILNSIISVAQIANGNYILKLKSNNNSIISKIQIFN